MRVFVLGTGRCASVSFWHACSHFTNYTTAHESPCGLLVYPDNHIEVNPQLRYVIQPLAERYPDALWVHLIRDRAACAASLARLNRGRWLEHFDDLCGTIMPNSNALMRAERVYDYTINQIENALQTHVEHGRHMVVAVGNESNLPVNWTEFTKRIDADGNLLAADKSWNTPTNTSAERGDA